MAVIEASTSSKPVMIHGERCATHCVHLVKAHCIAVAQVAGVLYSMSKLLVSNRVVDGLAKNFASSVAASLEHRKVAAPPINDLMEAVQKIMAMGGDLAWVEDGKSRSKSWLNSVERMCKQCRFDVDSRKWVYYLKPGEEPGQAGLARRALDSIVEPLVEVFVARRWETAALSRWVGVMSCMKRMALGVMFNGILPTTLASLQSTLGVTEESLQREIEKTKAQIAAGQEADEKTG